ncbi:hypothetical protein MPER_09138, partial [Moniliophthora perniciosa FA553]
LCKDPTYQSVWSAEWNQDNGLLVFRGKVYVPKDKDLRCRIVEQHYNSHVAGHPGRFKTLELVSCNYWWPQMNSCMGSNECNEFFEGKSFVCDDGGIDNGNDVERE